MKFHELTAEKWEQYGAYLDTCILPICGLTGNEKPPEVIQKLADIRDLLDWIETPFHGRVVTYPAIQYTAGNEVIKMVEAIVEGIRNSGFRFVVLVTKENQFNRENTHSDLVISSFYKSKEDVASEIISLWKSNVTNL